MSQQIREFDIFLNTDLPYEFDYLPKDRPYNEERYDKFISKKPKE